MNYFDKIRSLNNLQLAHFLKSSQARIELIGLAPERADNPKLYCSEDNHCIGTPDMGTTDRYKDTVYWWEGLSHRYMSSADMDCADDDPHYAGYVQKSYPEKPKVKDLGGKAALVCPACGNMVGKKMHYCPNCGKALAQNG